VKARILLPVLAALLVAYLLWPLSSRRWDIHFDELMVREKERFLQGLRQAPPPTYSRRPNVILIVADDLGKTDLSLYGGRAVATPNMDSIGSQGVTFTEGYATSSICCPSRAALLTGRDQNRFGFGCHMIDIYLRNRLMYLATRVFVDTDNMVPVFQRSVPRRSEVWKQGLPPSEITLGELLGAAGYHTAVTGKWHLGYSDIHHPNNRGFDYQYGFMEAFTLYAPEGREDIVSYRHDLFWERHIWSRQRKGPCAITRNGKTVEEEEYLTDAIARESVQFIREHLRERPGQPFFLYVPFSAPHTPFQAQRSYYDRLAQIEDPVQRLYCAMVANLDDAVGRILAALAELGIEQDTLVMFCSDNGGAVYTGGTTNAPLRGGKMTHFEGGLNVPFMMRWPGVIPPGTVVRHPVVEPDLFATAAAASGTPLPRDRPYDGVDLLPLVSGRLRDAPHQLLHWKTPYGSIVRQGRWKLICNSRQKLLRLYDLEEDPGEHVNLAARRPEIVAELSEQIRRWEARLPPPLWPNLMEVRWRIDGEEEIFGI
jgi:arylsulfatase A-like enzyme